MAEDKELYVTYHGQKITFMLHRSKRKTITLCVEEDGSIKVKAPNRVSQREIKGIVEKRGEWILQKQEQMRNLAQRFPKFQGKNGEQISYLGRNLTVRLVARERGIDFFSEEFKDSDGINNKVWCVGDTLYVSVIAAGNILHREKEASQGGKDAVRELTEEKISMYGAVRQMVEQWYRKEAKRYFASKIAYYEGKIGVRSNRLYIKDQKSRWGSCSSKGNINLNWRLLFAPEQIVAYVIVHELCHLKQMNHSAAFWYEVEKILPDYRERRQWLKEHGRQLQW